MAFSIVVGLLLAACVALAYRVSAGVAVRKKAEVALEPFRSLRNELTSQTGDIKNGVSQAAERLQQDVRTERLRSISVDTIKQHASGLRLQALKDAGLTTLLDVQGWSAERLSNLRGVGPKSAGTIAAVAQSLISSSNAQPLRLPSPPFDNGAERLLVRALYIQLYFEAHHAADRRALTDLVESSEERRAEIISGTTFASWSMSLLGSKRASVARDRAEVLARELQEDASALEVRRSIEEHLNDLRGIRMRTMAQEELLAAYVNESHLYEWMMADALGHRQSSPRPASRQQAGATAFVSSATSSGNASGSALLKEIADPPIEGVPGNLPNPLPSEHSEAAHVEFGRLVLGPPPQPTIRPTVEVETPNHEQVPQPAPWPIETFHEASQSEVPSPDKTPETHPSEQGLNEVVHVEFGRLVAGPPRVSQPRPAEPMPVLTSVPKTAEQALQQLERVQAAREADRQAGKSIASQSGAPAEELITLQIGQPVARSATSLPAPAPAPAPAKAPATQRRGLRWVTASETVVVQGITVAGSQFYLGDSKRNAERYAVDPALPIAEESQQTGDERALFHSYASFEPHIRFRYLAWLAGGARGRDVPSGFAKLYFQNLERRLLHQLRRIGGTSEEEIEVLLNEVRRIDTLFLLTPNSITYQAKCLLQFFEARAYIGAAMPALPARVGRSHELPFELRLGLGCFMKENQPIPANWALTWAYAEPTIFLRTAPLRCPEEFEAAFHHLYEERYGQGIVIEPNKTMLRVDYQPMWSGGDDSRVELTFTDVPDIKALTAPQSALGKLVADSTDLIDRYSRSLGATGKGAGTLEMLLRLPSILWKAEAKDKLDSFHSRFVGPMIPITVDALVAALEGDGEAGSMRIVELAKSLRAFGIGFEPDVLSGARKPKPSEFVVLFPLPKESIEATGVPAQAPMIAVTLAAILALADGYASNEEAAAADELVEDWPGLTQEDRTRLQAIYRLTLRQPPTLASFKSRLAALRVDHRKQVASALTMMAVSDGVVSADEVQLLERVYRMLALEAQTLYSDLHSSGGSQEPVVASSLASNVFLDPAKLKRLRAQSSEVGELLAGVFLEEDASFTSVPVIAPPPAAEPHVQASASEFRIPLGLSEADQYFLNFLVTKPMWSRQELMEAAVTFQIMLDGTLERINEAALNRIGDFLIDGDDPVYVQQTLLEAAE